MSKDELRRQIRQIKRQFTPQQLEELSLPIIARLRVRLAEAEEVFAYYSLPDEVDTHSLIDELLAAGKKVFLPKVIDSEKMEWHPYTSSTMLKPGVFGIGEPDETETQRILPFDSEQKSAAMVLVPGLAFDAAGHRLGRGRGYYDRFLAAHPDLYKIGVCFDFQKVAEVPVNEYDIPVDEVV